MSEWKNSPIISVIVVGATVLTTTLFIVFTYVLPVYQKEDKNRIAELQLDIQQKEKIIIEQKKNLDNIVSNDSYLSNLPLSSIYQKGSALPFGYSAITPGMLLTDVNDYYETPRVITTEGRTYLQVNVNSASLNYITYYASEKSLPQTITHIVVNKERAINFISDHEKYEIIRNVSLKKFLLENLGYKNACHENYYTWNFKDLPYSVFYSDLEPDLYGVYFNGYYPPTFDKECI